MCSRLLSHVLAKEKHPVVESARMVSGGNGANGLRAVPLAMMHTVLGEGAALSRADAFLWQVTAFEVSKPAHCAWQEHCTSRQLLWQCHSPHLCCSRLYATGGSRSSRSDVSGFNIFLNCFCLCLNCSGWFQRRDRKVRRVAPLHARLGLSDGRVDAMVFL